MLSLALPDVRRLNALSGWLLLAALAWGWRWGLHRGPVAPPAAPPAAR